MVGVTTVCWPCLSLEIWMVVLEGEDFCRESPEAILFTVLALVKVLGTFTDVWGSELLSSLAWVIVDTKLWGMDPVVRGKSWY